jgi:large subunit ribosomal protein L35
MPKLKTKKGASKRFRITANGKVKQKKAYKSHILTKKNSKRIRQLRKPDYLTGTDAKNIKKVLPYG